MKLKDLAEKYGEQEVLCWAERADESLEWVNIKLGKPNPKTVWDLGKGDSHVIVDECGKIREYGDWLNCLAEKNIRDIGNVFLTREEAEKDTERRKVETLLLKHGGRRWFKNHKPNWFIALEYEVEDNPRTYNATSIPKQGAIYFDTEEQAQKAVKEIGADRIKEALFEVR